MLNNNNGGSTSFICSDHTFRSIIIDGSILDPNTGPYYTSFLACHAVALATFIISSASGNLSQVDKLWSILPTIYAWMCVVDSRTTLMACLSTLWSLRLTYNFYRRGVSSSIHKIVVVYFTSPRDDVCNYILDMINMLHTNLTFLATCTIIYEYDTYITTYIILLSYIMMYDYRDMLGLHGKVTKTIGGSVYVAVC